MPCLSHKYLKAKKCLSVKLFTSLRACAHTHTYLLDTGSTMREFEINIEAHLGKAHWTAIFSGSTSFLLFWLTGCICKANYSKDFVIWKKENIWCAEMKRVDSCESWSSEGCKAPNIVHSICVYTYICIFPGKGFIAFTRFSKQAIRTRIYVQ